MLKVRLIGVVIIRDGLVVQSIGYKKYLPVGRPEIAIEYLSRWDIDEILLLDISASLNNTPPDHSKLKSYSARCHVPLAVGGGIKNISHIEKLIRSGADKVVINSAFFDNPSLVSAGAKEFGSQCIITSLDARKNNFCGYDVVTHSGRKITGLSPVEAAKKALDHGTGEILLTSVDNDGMKCGYDLKLLEAVINDVKTPVIICGGASCPEHLDAAVESGASAVAAANFFHFTEHSVILNKSWLNKRNSNIRSESPAKYTEDQIGIDGRVIKLDDAVLDRLRFEYIPEEKI